MHHGTLARLGTMNTRIRQLNRLLLRSSEWDVPTGLSVRVDILGRWFCAFRKLMLYGRTEVFYSRLCVMTTLLN